jgi:hypothetical protein
MQDFAQWSVFDFALISAVLGTNANADDEDADQMNRCQN